jgi:putative nucleotidyltransferase with HDIG domain
LQPSVVDRITQAVQDVPPISQVAHRLVQEMDNPDLDIAKVHDLLSKDPGIVGKVLAVANSAYYSRGANISSLRIAVLNLGLSTIRNIVVTIGTVGAFQGARGADRKRIERIWEHSLGTAYIAGLLARASRNPPGEDLYIHGLLHDLGKVVVARKFPDVTARLDQRLKETGSRIRIRQIETEELGFTHAQLGEAILTRWKFPEGIRRIVGAHHDAVVEGGIDHAIRMLALADAMSHALMGDPPDDDALATCPEVLEIDQEALEPISVRAGEMVAADKSLFGI